MKSLEHDYTGKGSWGHSIHNPRILVKTVEPSWLSRKLFGTKPKDVIYLTCLGHGRSVHPGDTILVKMPGSRKKARFLIEMMYHFDHPREMFIIEFAPFVEYI